MPTKIDSIFADFRVRFEASERDIAAINRRIATLEKRAAGGANAIDRMEKSTRRAGSAARKAKGDLAGMNKEAKATSMSMKQLIARFLGFEVARRFVVSTISTFVKYRTEMNNVRAITNATATEFARLDAQAKQLGATTQFTATSAAQAQTFLARTGLTVNQVLGAMPGTLNLAAATATDLASAADIATNVMKGMALQVEDLDMIVDVLAKTTNSANVDLFELGEGMKVVAPVAAAAGMSIQETAALIGVLGDAGIKGTLAGTSLRRMLVNLTTGAGTAGGAIERLGLQTRTAEGDFVGLTEIFRQLGERSVTDADLVELFGARAIAAAQVIRTRGVAGIEAFEGALDDAAGTADRMRKQQMEGLVGASKRMFSAFEALQLLIGDALEPALAFMAATIADHVLPFIGRMIGGFQLLGPAAFVMSESIIAAFKTVSDIIGVAIGGILAAIGRLLREFGELGERFGVAEELGERIANAGLRLELLGRRGIRNSLEDIETQGNRIKAAYGAAVEEAGEIIDKAAGITEETTAAAEAVGALADQVETVLAGFSAVAPTLDLAGFTTQLAEAQGQIRELFGLGGEGGFDLQEQLAIQGQLNELTDERRAKVDALLAAEQRLADTLAEIAEAQAAINAAVTAEDAAAAQDALAKAVRKLGSETRAVDKAMGGLQTTAKGAFRAALSEVEIGIRAVNRLADAFGFVDDGVRRAIDSVLDMVGALKAAQTAGGALSLASGLGIAAAGVGLVTGIVGAAFGTSADEAERRRVLEENTRALLRLNDTFDAQLAVLGAFTGSDLRDARRLAENILRVGADLTQEQAERLQGFDRARAIAESFGLTLDGTLASWQALTDAIKALDLAALTETFAGARGVAARRADLFDLSPEEQLLELIQLLNGLGRLPTKFAVGLAQGFGNVGTAAGRDLIRSTLQELFNAILSGEIGPEALGGLTAEQLLSLIQDIDNLVNEIGAGAGADEGATSNFVRDSRITVAQGSRVIALLDAIRMLNQQQLDLWSGATPIGAPSAAAVNGVLAGNVPAAAGATTVSIGTITITVSGAGEPAAVAERVAVSIAEDLDEALQEVRDRNARAAGE